jgi:hypothetical protein
VSIEHTKEAASQAIRLDETLSSPHIALARALAMFHWDAWYDRSLRITSAHVPLSAFPNPECRNDAWCCDREQHSQHMRDGHRGPMVAEVVLVAAMRSADGVEEYPGSPPDDEEHERRDREPRHEHEAAAPPCGGEVEYHDDQR